MRRSLIGIVVLGWLGCRGPAPEPVKLPLDPDKLAPDEMLAEEELVAPSRDALQALFGDHLELTDVYGPVVAGIYTRRGFLFCATARRPGSLEIGLHDPRPPWATGRLTVRIQSRGRARDVRLVGDQAVLNVGDELCLHAPPSDHARTWYRPGPRGRPEWSPFVDIGPLRAVDGVTFDGASRLATVLVGPRRIRAGDDVHGFSWIRLTAVDEGTVYCGDRISVLASQSEAVQVGVFMEPPYGSFGYVELRPGDTLTMPRSRVEPGLPRPALESL